MIGIKIATYMVIMRIAISFWQNSIAPVFDVSRSLRLVEAVNDREIQSTTVDLEAAMPFDRARKLKDLGIEVLICGAISRPYAMALWSQGIEVISCVFGSADEVLSEYLRGELPIRSERGPGRHRHQRRGRRTRGYS